MGIYIQCCVGPLLYKIQIPTWTGLLSAFRSSSLFLDNAEVYNFMASLVSFAKWAYRCACHLSYSKCQEDNQYTHCAQPVYNWSGQSLQYSYETIIHPCTFLNGSGNNFADNSKYQSLDAIYASFNERAINFGVNKEFVASGLFIGASLTVNSIQVCTTSFRLFHAFLDIVLQDVVAISKIAGVVAIRPVVRIAAPKWVLFPR